jgi:hypothetical protein
MRRWKERKREREREKRSMGIRLCELKKPVIY